MTNKQIEIIRLKDLSYLRTAPSLSKAQSVSLLKEAEIVIKKADWLTIGIMAPSIEIAISVIRRIEDKLDLNAMKEINIPNDIGPIFLKANQKSGEIHARIEFGLGEGVLISCHNFDSSITSNTIGPFPLSLF